MLVLLFISGDSVTRYPRPWSPIVLHWSFHECIKTITGLYAMYDFVQKNLNLLFDRFFWIV